MTVATILQILALIVPFGTVAALLYSARAQRRKTVGENEKVKQETKDLVDEAVREQAKFLADEIQQIRAELLAERTGRRDCDKHLIETTSALRAANRRIDSQDREIAELTRKYNDLSLTILANTIQFDPDKKEGTT